MATELIESASDLNLIVSTPNKNSNNNGALKRPGGLLRSGSMYSIYSHRLVANKVLKFLIALIFKLVSNSILNGELAGKPVCFLIILL